MDRRQKILATIENEFTLITPDNGFYNTVLAANVFRKAKGINELSPEIAEPKILFVVRDDEENEFKFIQRDETGEVIVPGKINSQGNTSPETIKKLYIRIVGVFISENDDDDEGLLSIEAEKLRKDIEDFFHRKKAISSTLNDIDGVQYSLIKRTQPYLDDTLHKGAITFDLYIEYFDNSDELEVSLPDIPTISSPSNGLTVTTNQPNIVWNSISGAISYQIQVASDNSFDTLLINQYFINDYAYTINSNDALSNGTYYVKVRAYSSVGYSDWSSTVTFIVNSSSIDPINWNQVLGAISWWNTYSSTGMTISSGISALLDQIGSRKLTQGTSTRRPALSGNAWGSLSSAFFNPATATESFVLGNNDTTAVFDWSNTSTGTFMFVMMANGYYFDNLASYNCVFARSNTSFGGQMSFIRGVNTGPIGYTYAYPGTSGDYMTIPCATGVPHQVIVSHSGSAHTVWIDGVKLYDNKRYSNLTITNNANTFLNMGAFYNDAVNHGSGKYVGHIFEAGFATASLTSGQVAALYEGFKDRFNL